METVINLILAISNTFESSADPLVEELRYRERRAMVFGLLGFAFIGLAFLLEPARSQDGVTLVTAQVALSFCGILGLFGGLACFIALFWLWRVLAFVKDHGQ